MMTRVPSIPTTSSSPNLLGAHRCTISDGTCALPRVSCGGRCPCCPFAIGAAARSPFHSDQCNTDVPWTSCTLQRREQRLPHYSSSRRHSHSTSGYEVTRIVRLPEHDSERECLRSALKAMRAAERRLADAKVSEHTHISRFPRRK